MSSIIDPGKAKRLIQEFQQQNASEGGPALKTQDGMYLNGFFIDRTVLESILNNPDAVGLSIYLAKHPDFSGKPDNVFTLTIAAAELNTESGATTPYVNKGDIYCESPPCPPWCGKLL